MFDKLSKREKKLAIIVGSLVPLVLCIMTLFWFLDAYDQNSSTIASLDQDISNAEELFKKGQHANLRRKYYTEVSFAGGTNKKMIDEARIDYNYWLDSTCKETMNLLSDSPDDRATKVEFKSSGGNQKKVVYFQKSTTLTATGTLDDLVAFLDKFYQFDALHKISGLTLTPLNSPNKRTKELIRTGQIRAVINVDYLHLADAVEKKDFEEFKQVALPKPLADYREAIVNRNIFGPANNVPTLDASVPRSIYPDIDISFRLTGKDADASDELAFELVDCKLEGANIRVESDRSATFTCSPQAIGEYPVKIRVKDNGFPSKETVEELVLVVKERPNSKPRFSTTRFTGIAGESMKFLIEVTDQNPNDELEITLGENEIEGVSLVNYDENSDGQLEETDNEADEDTSDDRESSLGRDKTATMKMQLIIPAQQPGRFSIPLLVTDGKVESPIAQNISITVDPPSFLDVERTKIGLISDTDGGICWISNLPKGEKFELKVGESCKVDKTTWTVEAINIDGEKNEVWLRHGGEIKRYELGDTLNKPRESKSADVTSTQTEDPTSTPVADAATAAEVNGG